MIQWHQTTQPPVHRFRTYTCNGSKRYLRGTHNGDLPHDLTLCAANLPANLACTQVVTYQVHAGRCASPLVFFDMNPLLLSSNQLHFGWVAVLVRLADIEAALS